jgi:hypothetical protein
MKKMKMESKKIKTIEMSWACINDFKSMEGYLSNGDYIITSKVNGAFKVDSDLYVSTQNTVYHVVNYSKEIETNLITPFI